MENITEILNCLCCGEGNLKLFFSMGDMPPCNRLVEINKEEPPIFPLALNWCGRCLHLQLTHAVDSDLLFSKYPYRTGYSTSHHGHFKKLAIHCSSFLNEGDEVADIGSNDGTLLSYMKGVKRSAIDPYVKPDEGNAECHFDCRWDMQIPIDLHKKFNLITATNVLAHNPSPNSFIANCCLALKDNGHLVIESPCSFDLIINKRFDTIYHEHISYFNSESMIALLKNFPLEIISIEKIKEHHGETIRFTIKKVKENLKTKVYSCDSFSNIRSFYDLFTSRVQEAKERMIYYIQVAKENNYEIIGFGASAKAVTLLNFFGYKTFPSCILDETPGKANKFTPKSSVPIVSYSELKNRQEHPKKILFLMYTWNCFEESMKKLKEFAPESEKLVYHYNLQEPVSV